VDARAAGLGVSSIREINALGREAAAALYARLVPAELVARLSIDARGFGPDGGRLLSITAPADQPWARVEVRSRAEDRDPTLLVDVEMSSAAVPELAFVQITDPAAPRYGIDRAENGDDTLFGTTARNLEEERRAMKDGLAPGQVRPGQRLLPRVIAAMEDFCRLIGKDVFLIEPLFYHSAILYERRGCDYLMGRETMDDIQAGFAADGALRAALDGSTPFRQPGAERTVRGRSWALHDGVGRFAGVKMYKLVGRAAGVDTFPGGPY
jgi:hypothetical protein